MTRFADTYAGLRLERRGRTLIARFTEAHRTLVSCPVTGGYREDLQAVYNHQLCEPAGHDSPAVRSAVSDQAGAHVALCSRHGLVPERTASMLTAASMRCAGTARRVYRDLVVIAVCTAGVEGNAGRAGDRAGYVEWDGRYVALDGDDQQSPGDGPAGGAHTPDGSRTPDGDGPPPGTINTMLFCSHELSPGATVQVVVTATEAKAAVLADLAIGSRYGTGIATGTGTDQIAVASRIGSGQVLTGAGKHTLLGQYVAETVGAAIREALSMQNGIEPASRRSVAEQLRRFGFQWRRCLEVAERLLPAEQARLLSDNVASIDGDPVVVSVAAGLAAVADQVTAGVYPPSCTPELALTWAVHLACAVAGEAEPNRGGSDLAEPDLAEPDLAEPDWAEPDWAQPEWAALDSVGPDRAGLDLSTLVPAAIVVGFAEKWNTG